MCRNIIKRLIWLSILGLMLIYMPACGSENNIAAPAAGDGKSSGVTKKYKKEYGSQAKILDTNQGSDTIVERNIVKLPNRVDSYQDLDEVVVSASENEGKPLTRRELNSLIEKNHSRENLEEGIVSITVMKPGEKGLTYKEFDEMVRKNQADSANEILSITIDPSGKGMTESEFEAWVKSQNQFNLEMESGISATPGGNPLTYRELDRLFELYNNKEKE